MQLELIREEENGNATFGTLFMDGVKVAVTLEDAFHNQKIPGETCIPCGTYDIRLRADGGMAPKYKRRFGNDHKGMMWLQDVPDFTFVYIHIGNHTADTKGCILVGRERGGEGIVGSGDVYASIYPHVIDAIDAGERVSITIRHSATYRRI